MRRWMSIGLVASVGVAAVGSASCRRAGPPAFSAAGFTHEKYQYRVAALPSGDLVAPPWRLDNYYRQHSTGPLVPKKNEPEVKLWFDTDGDGEHERTEKYPVADLVFVNDETAAVIRLRTLPISAEARVRSLDVIMNEFLEALAGESGEASWTGTSEGAEPGGATVESTSKTFAATLAESTQGTLAGAPAVFATIDVANLEQLKLDPAHRYRRLRVVIARMPFEYELMRGRKSSRFPVLMVCSYGSLPQHFDAGVAVFHDVLSRVSVGNERGFEAGSPVTSAAPAASEAPAPPPPAESAAPPAASSAPSAVPAASAPTAPPPR